MEMADRAPDHHQDDCPDEAAMGHQMPGRLSLHQQERHVHREHGQAAGHAGSQSPHPSPNERDDDGQSHHGSSHHRIQQKEKCDIYYDGGGQQEDAFALVHGSSPPAGSRSTKTAPCGSLSSMAMEPP